MPKLFKIKNEHTLERYQWRRSSILIANCELISNFVVTDDFEQANVCWVHIEKPETFDNKIGYIMGYVAAF